MTLFLMLVSAAVGMIVAWNYVSQPSWVKFYVTKIARNVKLLAERFHNKYFGRN